jgi:hypothetical protein
VQPLGEIRARHLGRGHRLELVPEHLAGHEVPLTRRLEMAEC